VRTWTIKELETTPGRRMLDSFVSDRVGHLNPWAPLARRARQVGRDLDRLLETANAIVRRSDNGDTIEPGWHEVEELREAIAQLEKPPT
jgi:hypothetical protein